MDKLIAQWMRLYLVPGFATPERLARHLQGQETLAIAPVGGQTRCLVLPFPGDGSGGDAHWSALCELASILQAEYGFPAPAVSISGADGYRLWLSFADPVPVAQAQLLLERLRAAHGCVPVADASLPVPLPPCLDNASGKWAAFINPGMGASFAEEPGLEMAPPLAAQTAFLEGLESIGPAQFGQVLAALAPAPAPGPAATPAQPQAHAPADATPREGLLLRDATLEDIVRHLHALNIEPTFRHLLPGRS
ncbi:hypothetical protein [Massilia sp. GCM10023247]|uniref:hypothetical protein n=1 Tax=Massilia sp. GCM10023247 TaxID=3252643 RepID=UPI00361A3FC9